MLLLVRSESVYDLVFPAHHVNLVELMIAKIEDDPATFEGEAGWFNILPPAWFLIFYGTAG